MYRARQTKVCQTLLIGAAISGLLVLPAQGQVRGDFDGDGFADLAVGVPNETVGRVHGAGAVNVIYGRAGTGLSGVGDQIWHQDTPGIFGVAETSDNFGHSLAVGDFNGDGYSDLAIGVANEDIDAIVDGGAINVIYGSAAGLITTDNQVFHQDTDDVEDDAEAGDRFGYALAAGDFNRDGYDELAIGVPGEGVSGLIPRTDGAGVLLFDDFGAAIFDPVVFSGAGAVNVLFGSVDGLSAAGDQIFHQESQFLDLGDRVTGIAGVAWTGDEFGRALAVGDYNGDAADDLAIGARGESLEAIRITGGLLVDVTAGLPGDAGVIHVLFSDWSGLSPVGSQLLHQNIFETQAIAERADAFGTSLASGDFNGDTYDDLAVGVPYENVAFIPRTGAVHIFYGFHEGLKIKGNLLLHQDIDGVLGKALEEENFGFSVAAGDFDLDGYDDLAVGVPHENIGSVHGAGAVNVFYGRAAGLGVEDNQRWHQGSTGIAEKPEIWDQFGHSLTSGDFNGDGACDLAIGVFNESVGPQNGAGAVNVLYGRSGRGLRFGLNQLWHQGRANIEGGAEPVDYFGFAVASGY